MQEYWVNVYVGIQPYQCHKFQTKECAMLSIPRYDYPAYRLHVRLKHKPIKPKEFYKKLDKFDWMS